jgi:peroxiredoxin
MCFLSFKENKMKFITILSFLFLFSVTSNAQPVLHQQAYEIALPDAEGDTIRLSSFKGNLVLIDFWASWCGPCRISNKALTKIYPKYKNKGFEIFAVSLDENERSWKKAIAKDKITWKQVIAIGGWYSATAETWKIEQLPTSFLLDKEGKIIAIDPDIKELEMILKKL